MIRSAGLEAVSLRRLAASLDVTAPALYAYVEDKEDLLRAVAEGEFDRLMAAFAEVDDDDPIERMRRLGRVYVDHALAEPELFRTMFVFPPELPVSSATGQELPAATKTFEMALGATTDAAQRGRLGELDPLTAALTTWTAMHGLAHVLLLGFEFDPETREELIDSVIDTVLRGLESTGRSSAQS